MTASTLPNLATPVKELARPDFVRLRDVETVGEALTRLHGEGIGERVVYFYVTDQEGVLAGVVPTRRLLLCDTSASIREVMVHPVVSVRTVDTFGEALELLAHRRLLALPVVDEAGRLCGVLDASMLTESLVDLERRESAEQLFQLAGVHIEEQRSRHPFYVLAKRFPWLLCNIMSGLLAAWLTRRFDVVLQEVVALTFFIPLLLTLAESVAMQTLTLSLSRIQVADGGAWKSGVSREVQSGLLLGLGSGAIAGLIAVIWLNLFGVAAVVAVSILATAALGSALGFWVPLLVRRWKLNPSVASGPVTLALTDLAALAVYFSLAAAVLTRGQVPVQ